MHACRKFTVDPRARDLRRSSQKRFREGSDLALFCYGLGQCVLHKTVWYALHEDADFDGVALWEDRDYGVFTPLQLKELVSEEISPRSSLQDVISGLSKYQGREDLVGVIRVNRKIDVSSIAVPPLTIAGLWIFGADGSEQNLWYLHGDLLSSERRSYWFTYPDLRETESDSPPSLSE